MCCGYIFQWCCWRAVSAYLDCSYAYWHLQICNQQKISWWIFEKHEISAFCTASCGRDPSVMQLTSSSSPPWFKSLLFLLLHLQLWNLLIWKKLLSIVLHDLLRGPSMMLLTSCSSIPWLLICLVAPSDLQSSQNFVSEFNGYNDFFEKTCLFIWLIWLCGNHDRRYWDKIACYGKNSSYFN